MFGQYVHLLGNTWQRLTVKKILYPPMIFHFNLNYVYSHCCPCCIFFYCCFLFPKKQSHLYAVPITTGVFLKFNSKHMQKIQPSFTNFKKFFWYRKISTPQRSSYRCNKVKIQSKCYLSFRLTALLYSHSRSLF